MTALARADWRPLIDAVLAEFAHSSPEPGVRDALSALFERVVEWNRRADLTAARSSEELVDLYLADAACLGATIEASASERWVDVGSGAGAPAIPLALLRPRISIELVEPRSKRVAFLRTLVGALELPNVRVTRARSEELGEARAVVAVSRATFPPEQWLGEGARLAEHAVWVLLARDDAPSRDGWRVERDLSYRWPLTGVARRAVRFVRSS